MDIIVLLIAIANIIHWDMRSRNIPIKQFGQCPTEWRLCTLCRAMAIIMVRD